MSGSGEGSGSFVAVAGVLRSRVGKWRHIGVVDQLPQCPSEYPQAPGLSPLPLLLRELEACIREQQGRAEHRQHPVQEERSSAYQHLRAQG